MPAPDIARIGPVFIEAAIGKAARCDSQRTLIGARIRNRHRVAAALLAIAATAMAAARFAQ